MPPTLREALSTRDNSLNFVRLVLAASVIVYHAWALEGFDYELPFNIGIWAVNGFFALSGYLIAGSRMRLNFRTFMLHRALRIYPAFWVVLVVVAFVFAPLLSVYAGWDYTPTSAAGYVVKNASLYIVQPEVWGTLIDLPTPNMWNGPLWTLFYEFAAYIVAAVLLTAGAARRHPILVTSIALGGAIVLQFLALGPWQVESNFVLFMLRLGACFAAGMLLYFLGDRLKLNAVSLAIAVVALAALAALGQAETLGQLPFGFILLWIGGRLPIKLGQANDISYGLYIWGWPVGQVLATIGTHQLGPIGTGLLTLVLTIPLAWASWKLVEKPAMELRKRVPKKWLGAEAKVSAP